MEVGGGGGNSRVGPRLPEQIGPVGEINVRLLLTEPRLVSLTGSTQGLAPPISDV